jgi:spore germination protein KA
MPERLNLVFRFIKAKRAVWQTLLLSASLDKNIEMLKAVFANCSDVVFRQFTFAQNGEIRLALIYTEGLADKKQVGDQIIRALSLELPAVVPGGKIKRDQVLDLIEQRGLCIQKLDEASRVERVVDAVLSGDTVLLADGHATAIINSARGWAARPVEDSVVDRLVRGPREAFVETLGTNTSLLRRKIKNPDLKIETIKIGRVTRTDVAVVYIQGIADPKILAEVRRRLARIDIDGILEGGYIEELIEDNPLSPFCTINHSDRVDKVAAFLLEGRVAIMVDGTPNVMTVPALFTELLHNPEDYYQRYIFSSAVRMLRVLTLFLTLLTPSIYLAIVTYHPQLLPTSLLLSLAAQREALPFPAFVEVMLMELTFEILREAGIRMPQPMGQALSIVGALVIGEAAVRAGMVAPATVIVVAVTGIASFTFCYTASITLRLIRFPLLLASGMLGLYGLGLGLFVLLVHLVGLRSFGVPFLYPLAPLSFEGLKDVAVRAPWWAMFVRPRLLAGKKIRRINRGLKPGPPGKKGK